MVRQLVPVVVSYDAQLFAEMEQPAERGASLILCGFDCGPGGSLGREYHAQKINGGRELEAEKRRRLRHATHGAERTDVFCDGGLRRDKFELRPERSGEVGVDDRSGSGTVVCFRRERVGEDARRSEVKVGLVRRKVTLGDVDQAHG